MTLSDWLLGSSWLLGSAAVFSFCRKLTKWDKGTPVRRVLPVAGASSRAGF